MYMDDVYRMLQEYGVENRVFGRRIGRGNIEVDLLNGVFVYRILDVPSSGSSRIGTKQISMELGRFRAGPMQLAPTFVVAHWGFDESYMLLDVHITRTRPGV